MVRLQLAFFYPSQNMFSYVGLENDFFILSFFVICRAASLLSTWSPHCCKVLLVCRLGLVLISFFPPTARLLVLVSDLTTGLVVRFSHTWHSSCHLYASYVEGLWYISHYIGLSTTLLCSDPASVYLLCSVPLVCSCYYPGLSFGSFVMFRSF